MTRRPCRETFGHGDLPGICEPHPKTEPFNMPCSNPHPGHSLHRVHYEANHAGRIYDIRIEWTVKEVVHVVTE